MTRPFLIQLFVQRFVMFLFLEVPDVGCSGERKLNYCLIWPTMSLQLYLVSNSHVLQHCWCVGQMSICCISESCFCHLGYQTLGEEYVSIIQVDPSKRRIPSRMRRTALIFFHTFVPYLLDKVLICVENELETEANSQRQTSRTWNPLSHVRFWIQRAVGMLTESQRKSLIPLIFALQQGITLLYRLHVAVFYISGAFYHIGKRAAGVSYVSFCSFTIIKSVLWE